MNKAYFTISDRNNLPHYEKLKNSLAKFNTAGIPLILIDEEKVAKFNDPHFYYRATPLIAKELKKQGYEYIVKIDADSLILGDLDHVWKALYDVDVAVVQNSNPREAKNYPVTVWDIDVQRYVNCGFVGMHSEEFIDHWLEKCYTPAFYRYQFREQDILNILVYWGNYKVEWLDSGDKFHGLVAKQYEPQMILKDGKVILPQSEEWPKDGDKQIVCYHFAGGNDPNKGNYRNKFQPEVVKYIDELVKP